MRVKQKLKHSIAIKLFNGIQEIDDVAARILYVCFFLLLTFVGCINVWILWFSNIRAYVLRFCSRVKNFTNDVIAAFYFTLFFQFCKTNRPRRLDAVLSKKKIKSTDQNRIKVRENLKIRCFFYWIILVFITWDWYIEHNIEEKKQ